MLDELAAWLPGRRMGRGDQLDDLARVKRAAPAGGDDPPGALVEHLDLLGGRIVDFDSHLVRRRHVEPEHTPADLAVALAQLPLEQDDLDPQTGGQRDEPLDEPPQLVRAWLHHRPDVKLHPVPQQPAVDRAVRLVGAQRAEHVDEHLLELGESDDLAALVVDAREVADLPEDEQSLVLRIGPGDPVERVDVLRGRQPFEVKLAEPPHVQTVTHHRVQAPQHFVLLEPAPLGRPEREQVDRGHTPAPTRLRDRRDDPMQRGRDRDALVDVREQRRELLV